MFNCVNTSIHVFKKYIYKAKKDESQNPETVIATLYRAEKQQNQADRKGKKNNYMDSLSDNLALLHSGRILDITKEREYLRENKRNVFIVAQGNTIGTYCIKAKFDKMQ